MFVRWRTWLLHVPFSFRTVRPLGVYNHLSRLIIDPSSSCDMLISAAVVDLYMAKSHFVALM